MKFRFAFTALALATVLFTGCEKIKSIRLSKKKTTKAETTTIVATPTPVPTPTPAPSANRSASVIVLIYHRFEENLKSPMSISPTVFEAQMQQLKDDGFSVISMQDFLAWRRNEQEIPEKSALITIDDGYVSAYEIAWPILKKFDYPFTMFVYTQYINSGGKSIRWDQLAEMRDAGVEIGCHSLTHQNLKARLSKSAAEIKQMGYDEWLRKEIIESKRILEKQLGIKASVFAYPEGAYNERAREIVKEAGYEAAFSAYGQRNTFTTPAIDIIGRYAVEAGKPKTFEVALAMIGGGAGPGMSMAVTPVMAEPVTEEFQVTPANGETVSDPKPLIQADLSSLGEIEPGSVTMRISGFGLVPAQYNVATRTIRFQPTTQPLRDKEYTVFVVAKAAGKRTEIHWSFKFD